jgi:hypothetical protein
MSRQTRRDARIENDSGGFSVVPWSALDRIIEDDRTDDVAIVTAHQAMLLMLHGDDSFPARLVVDAALNADEAAEWLACATWRLAIPCGRVLLAGGFDPTAFDAFREGEEWGRRCVAEFDVSPGDYRVDIYTHRATISGRFLDGIWPNPLGAWFRREHPGRPFPGWMGRELELSPELDPGHESEWRDPMKAGRLASDETRDEVIGYLVHLTPWLPRTELSALPADGWFEPETGQRVPARCPLGLIADVPPE